MDKFYMNAMQYITQEYFNFFQELAANNHKEWFDVNRNRYEQFVKRPFEQLTTEIAIRLAELDTHPIVQAPNQCIFRINRDIRFSKDKTPYKLHRAAAFGINGKKTEEPCYYFAIGPNNFEVGGGMYDVSKENLHKIRQEIFYNSAELNVLMEAKSFKENFQVYGEKNKIIPKEYREFAKDNPIIFHKQYYVFTELSQKDALSSNLADILMNVFSEVKPFNDYLWEAILD